MNINMVRVAVFVLGAGLALSGTALAGQTQAERDWAKRQKADPESALGWNSRPALETGGLPSKGETVRSGSGKEEGIPTVEIGGRSYRVGIDIP